MVLLFLYTTTIVISFFAFFKKRRKLLVASIFCLALLPRLSLIGNPALGNNDEKYHALVAKNMTTDPLTPQLYTNPLLPYNINDYTSNHIWLSKPPITFWLMSTNINLFGANVYSIRLTSLLLSLFSLLIIFRLGKLFYNDTTAYIATFFMAIHGSYIELGAGELSSDHVDITFLTFFLLTTYLTVLFYKKKRLAYPLLFLIGSLIGLVFLIKWQASFFLFPLITYALIKQNLSALQNIKIGLVLVFAVILTTAPWLLYIYWEHPLELQNMMIALIDPIQNTVQGHTGPWYYYLLKMGQLFGEIVYLPLLFLLLSLYKKPSWQTVFLSLWIFVPLLLFSIAETKRFTYILVAAPAIFIYCGHFISTKINTNLKAPNWLQIVIITVVLALPIRFSIERIDFLRDNRKLHNQAKNWQKNLELFLVDKVENNVVIFNEPRYIETMFYSNSISYQNMPNTETITALSNEGYSCYKFSNGNYFAIE